MSVRTTRITVETETITVVRRARVDLGWCPQCGGEADLIRLAESSQIDPATAAQIERWQRTNQLHLLQSSDRSMQICVKSLMRCIEDDEAETRWLPGGKDGKSIDHEE